jgi:glyoxylase-like metal-dependent hydrolase (beta-lactamase superfamily II)/uncharacterized protein with ACT and thioredoxin-like domain
MDKYSFIARIPDEPGSLHKAAAIVSRHRGNIIRLQFDKRIDPYTVFFEVTAGQAEYDRITAELNAIGYLQTSLKTASFLRFFVHLPHRPGALNEILNFTTTSGANIAYIDFDDKGRHPDRLTVSLNLEDSAAAGRLLEELKPRYRLEILEYDTSGAHLDDTVFYLRFAQEIRALIGESEDRFLLRLLGDVNHIVQELCNLGKDPKLVFDSILLTGRTLSNTTGPGFYADVQRVAVGDNVTLSCFQLPCGGNIFLIDSPSEQVMIDTGYGCYHADVRRMLESYGCLDEAKLSRLVITHADADHCGAAGYYRAVSLMHRETGEIIRQANRAYGSRSEGSILEEVYTTLINLFSGFLPPKHVRLLPPAGDEREGIFPVVSRFQVGGLEFEVLEGLGGHLCGQVYLLCRTHGLLFTADTVINFAHLTPERADYNSLAVLLVTSVNVDSEIASRERIALLGLAAEMDRELEPIGRRCLICGGHGPVSVLADGGMAPYGTIERYTG